MDFHYQAANAQGHVLVGNISATTEREAIRQLQQQNLTPISLAAVGAAPKASSRTAKKPSSQDKTLAIQELSTLLNAGVPLAESVVSERAGVLASTPRRPVNPSFTRLKIVLRFWAITFTHAHGPI